MNHTIDVRRYILYVLELKLYIIDARCCGFILSLCCNGTFVSFIIFRFTLSLRLFRISLLTIIWVEAPDGQCAREQKINRRQSPQLPKELYLSRRFEFIKIHVFELYGCCYLAVTFEDLLLLQVYGCNWNSISNNGYFYFYYYAYNDPKGNIVHQK